MSRPNWYKKTPQRYRPFKRRILWRSWLHGTRSFILLTILITVGQFYIEGAVTWPDSMMRSADGYARSVFQELPSFGKNEPQEPPSL